MNMENKQERESKQSSLLVSMVIWTGSLVGDRIPPKKGGYESILIALLCPQKIEGFESIP